jgi:hypothetical protein
VQELDGRLDQLNPDEIFVGLDRIENSIGDGHTYIRLPSDSPANPVRFGRFGDQYRLLAAANSIHSPDAVGGSLLSIDDVPRLRSRRNMRSVDIPCYAASLIAFIDLSCLQS